MVLFITLDLEIIMYAPNPFTNLTVFLSPLFMQAYIVLMVIAVALGTIYDLLHGSKTAFFSRQRKKSRGRATREIGGGEAAAIAAKTIVTNVATSGEFHASNRRASHLLMLYGFVLYLVTTVIMIFFYPLDVNTPIVLPVVWNIGAVMLIGGGLWFFLFLRVNVSHDGHGRLRLIRADLFILALLVSVIFAIVLELVEMAQNNLATEVFFGIYLFFTTLLFVSVPWSKFSHMFYKPGVAIQKKLEEASGSSDLPSPYDGRHGGV